MGSGEETMKIWVLSGIVATIATPAVAEEYSVALKQTEASATICGGDWNIKHLIVEPKQVVVGKRRVLEMPIDSNGNFKGMLMSIERGATFRMPIKGNVKSRTVEVAFTDRTCVWTGSW